MARRKRIKSIGTERTSHRAPTHYRKKPAILVVCEGKKSEPFYFRLLGAVLRDASVTLAVVSVGKGGFAVVEKAAQLVDWDRYQAVWCVLDHEGIHSDPADFERAVRLADELGFELAISNPTFELWYLFHLIPISPDATIYRSAYDVIAALAKQMGRSYIKGDAHFAAKVLQRARADLPTLIAEAARTFPYATDTAPGARCANPTTHVHRLVGQLL